jgi:hypothetical protein
MKNLAKSSNNTSITFKNTIINNDLKKYQNDPLVIKKAEKATELLKKVKNLNNIL